MKGFLFGFGLCLAIVAGIHYLDTYVANRNRPNSQDFIRFCDHMCENSDDCMLNCFTVFHDKWDPCTGEWYKGARNAVLCNLPGSPLPMPDQGGTGRR